MPMRFLSPLARDTRGNVAIIFGLMCLPVMFLAGSGYDYSRASRLRIKLQAAVDGTVLTLCQMPSTTSDQAIEQKAQELIGSYMPEGATLVTPVQVTTKPREIQVTATSTSPTVFAGLLGFQKLDVAATARCAPPYPKIFEVALVLDTTGSMEVSGKLSAAKKAAKDFIDYVEADDSFDAESRIAIVPFSSAVAVDPTVYGAATPWIDGQARSDYHWTNIDIANADAVTRTLFTSRFAIFNHLKSYVPGWGWAGCFETLPYPLNTRVEAPSAANKNGYFVPMFAPDEPGADYNRTATISTTSRYNNPSSNSTYKNLSPATQSFDNSYLNDETSLPTCAGKAMTAQEAESRACKYRLPIGYSATSANSLGVPNGPNFLCSSKPLKQLTKDFSSLKTYIDTLYAQGSTNIFEGLMWGWRTISPKSVFADGSADNKPDVMKVIVLMSDGENSWNSTSNFNRSTYLSYGYFNNADGSNVTSRFRTGTANPSNASEARAAMDALTLEGCTNAKTAGYQIYTVGFSVAADPIDAAGLALLKSCASADSQFFVAKSGTELVDAFKRIAEQIGKLRLTQ